MVSKANGDSAINNNLTANLGGMTFGIDSNGNYGYIKAGADSVTPFRTDKINSISFTCVLSPANGIIGTYTLNCSKDKCNVIFNISKVANLSSGYINLIIDGVIKKQVAATGTWSFAVSKITSIAISLDKSGSDEYRYVNGTITLS